MLLEKNFKKKENKMGSIAIEISEDLVNTAKSMSKTEKRSAPKQIEHWARIGKIAEENPELSFKIIRDILLGREQIKQGKFGSYVFGEGE